VKRGRRIESSSGSPAPSCCDPESDAGRTAIQVFSPKSTKLPSTQANFGRRRGRTATAEDNGTVERVERTAASVRGNPRPFAIELQPSSSVFFPQLWL
jgi:hypothetical protein